MKHKLLSIFHLFLFTVFASAQGHYASVLWEETSFLSVSGHPERTIVRGWNSQYLLSCHRDNSGTKLALLDASTFHSSTPPAGLSAPVSITNPLPPNVFIHDICIIHDHAFLCGEYGGEGVVGHIDLAAMAPPSTSINIDYVRCTTNISRLNRIVATRNPTSGFIIACIGEDAANNYDDRAFFIKFSSSFNTVYETYNLPSDESMDDVLYDGNNFVFVGRLNATPLFRNDMIVRRHNPSGSGASINDRHTFSTGTREINATTRSTLLREDLMAVSYVHYNTVDQTLSTRVRFINPGNMLMTGSQDFDRVQKEEVVELAYSASCDRLAVMYPEKNPASYHMMSKTVFLNPSSTVSYTTDCIFHTASPFFGSITTFKNPSNQDNVLVAASCNRWLLQHIPSINPVATTCPEGDVVGVHVISNIAPTVVAAPTSYSLGSPIPGPLLPVGTNPSTTSAVCHTIRVSKIKKSIEQ